MAYKLYWRTEICWTTVLYRYIYNSLLYGRFMLCNKEEAQHESNMERKQRVKRNGAAISVRTDNHGHCRTIHVSTEGQSKWESKT